MKEDFILRTISEGFDVADKNGAKFNVLARRSRASSGHAMITLDIRGARVLELSNVLEDYQEVARQNAQLL